MQVASWQWIDPLRGTFPRSTWSFFIRADVVNSILVLSRCFLVTSAVYDEYTYIKLLACDYSGKLVIIVPSSLHLLPVLAVSI
jgi:hypothetical protein